MSGTTPHEIISTFGDREWGGLGRNAAENIGAIPTQTRYGVIAPGGQINIASAINRSAIHIFVITAIAEAYSRAIEIKLTGVPLVLSPNEVAVKAMRSSSVPVTPVR